MGLFNTTEFPDTVYVTLTPVEIDHIKKKNGGRISSKVGNLTVNFSMCDHKVEETAALIAETLTPDEIRRLLPYINNMI